MTAEIEFATVDWRELVPEVARKVAQVYVQPANLAGLTGSVLLPLMIFRHKPSLFPYLVVAMAGWAGGRLAYQATRDLHDLATVARGDA